MAYEKERRYYRIQVPPGDVAFLEADGKRMPIREVSERGIRYDPAPGHAPEPGAQVSGSATFKTLGATTISGRFDRNQGKSVVIVLEPPGIPYATLMALQRYIRQRYPGR